MGVPAFKFIILAVRQITKPVVKYVVAEAKEHAVICRVCVSLGRVSLGMSGVIAKWSVDQDERLKGRRQHLGASSGSTSPSGSDKPDATAPAGSVNARAPRSRSLLKPATPPSGRDAPSPLRFPLRLSVQSSWEVFQRCFLAPIPQQALLDAGAELLVELLAYSVLAFLLYWELSTASKSQEAKEKHLMARIGALEEKVNELAQRQEGIGQLIVVPPPEAYGRVSRLTSPIGQLARRTSDLASGNAAEGNRHPAAPSATSPSPKPPASVSTVGKQEPHEEAPPSIMTGWLSRYLSMSAARQAGRESALGEPQEYKNDEALYMKRELREVMRTGEVSGPATTNGNPNSFPSGSRV